MIYSNELNKKNLKKFKIKRIQKKLKYWKIKQHKNFKINYKKINKLNK